jgi:hypothetical protein
VAVKEIFLSVKLDDNGDSASECNFLGTLDIKNQRDKEEIYQIRQQTLFSLKHLMLKIIPSSNKAEESLKRNFNQRRN